MDKIKLPSMVEYTKKAYSAFKLDNDSALYKIVDFANFLSQQPNISMFVPSVLENGEWRILTEPKDYHCFIKGIGGHIDVTFQEYKQYQTALDNVIFEECGLMDDLALQFPDGTLFCNIEELHKYTIQDLLDYNLTLTPKIAKELGL